jgi:hypothetical protein
MTAQPTASATGPVISNDSSKRGNAGVFTLGALLVAGLLFAWL